MTTSKRLNEQDAQRGRRVWFQYWDSHITFERSYLARLNYVHQNPVHHGVADNAENYAWCSAAWFGRNAPASFVATVKSFKTDKLSLPDEFCLGVRRQVAAFRRRDAPIKARTCPRTPQVMLAGPSQAPFIEPELRNLAS
jgi:hypothetical protein